MPKFMDQHAMPQLPPEAVQAMRAQVQAGQADAFGVVPLNVFVAQNGRGWCLTEAASAEAVRQGHAAMGITLGPDEITEVMSLV
ncbi:MAG: DUF4242 domain-containing protein [Chloroflexi bacterium]|nr:DUF4242 domain-containing protein [Chloroflexota bacterium]